MPIAAGRRTSPSASKRSARAAGLVYVSADTPGIRRTGANSSFKYKFPNGKPVTDKQTLGRIKRLAIPPAWTDVWICTNADGHLQAVGRDARGRKQYRYHSRWREVRDETKYAGMLAFARALPGIRQRVEKHLQRPGLNREKVLATVIRILEKGFIRVGNDEYARTNKSFGLTTLRDRHVEVNGSTITFQFRGKSGKNHKIDLRDRRLARIVAHCQAIPGQELFQYLDEQGNPRDITSSDVNEYLREISGGDFTAKDFRTWAGTVLAAMALRDCEECETKKQAQKNLKAAIESVAKSLGNTPAICKKCYIHPFIIQAYLDGRLKGVFWKETNQSGNGMTTAKPLTLRPEESAVLDFLHKQITAERKNQRSTLVEKLAASLKHRAYKGQKGQKNARRQN